MLLQLETYNTHRPNKRETPRSENNIELADTMVRGKKRSANNIKLADTVMREK